MKEDIYAKLKFADCIITQRTEFSKPKVISGNLEINNKILTFFSGNIEDEMFRKTNIDKVIVPNSTISIGNYSFDDSELSEIKLPFSIKNIGRCAFRRCLIKNIILPDGIENMAKQLFEIAINYKI